MRRRVKSEVSKMAWYTYQAPACAARSSTSSSSSMGCEHHFFLSGIISRNRSSSHCLLWARELSTTQAEAQPEVRFGVAGIEFDGLLEIRDGEFGAAAELRGDVVIADATGHIHHGRLGRLLHGLVDGVLGLGAVGEAAHDVGDGLAVEGAEEAIVLGAGGFQGDGFFGEPDALLGDLAAGFAVAQLDDYLGEIAIGQGGAVLGLGIVGGLGGGGAGLGGELG